MTVPRPAHYFTRRDRYVSLAGPRPGQKGDGYDFTSDRYSDYLRRRCDLLLGHRKVCPRRTTCKSSQAARGADLSRVYPSAGCATGGNWRTVAAKSMVDIAVALLSEHHLLQLPWAFSLGLLSTIDRWIAHRANLNRIARPLAFRNSPFGECKCGAPLWIRDSITRVTENCLPKRSTNRSGWRSSNC